MKKIALCLSMLLFLPANASAAELLNISTRGFVGTGAENMHAGFVITGGGNLQVLIKVRGPSLPPVLNKLANPVLKLFDTNSGQLIHQNDNWQSDPSANLVIATGLAPTDPNEPAFVITLPDGSYTAVASGDNETTGIGIPSVTEVDVRGPVPPNQAKTERMIGSWEFVSLISNQLFDDSYTLLPPAREFPADTAPGVYFVNGTDRFGDPVRSGYDPKEDNYILLDELPDFDQLYIFNFNHEHNVRGCLFAVFSEDEMSPCHQTTGFRIPEPVEILETPISEALSRTGIQKLNALRSSAPFNSEDDLSALALEYYKLLKK